MTDLLLLLENTDPEAAAWTLALLVAAIFAAWYRVEQKRLRDLDTTLPPKRPATSLWRYGKGKKR